MIDTHGHCQFPDYGGKAEEMMNRTKEKNTIVNIVGTDKKTSADAVALVEKYDFAFATIGLHPENLFQLEHEPRVPEPEFDLDFYDQLAQHPKVIGVGEGGLDFFHLPKDLNREQAIAKQTEVFLAQAELAKKYSLPLVLHCRDAHAELIELLKTLSGMTGTLHCFTANWGFAQQYLDLGHYLGFTGIITFPPKKSNPQAQAELLEVVKKAPLDRILVETDCPYLAPQAYRGKQCEPWMIEEIIKKIAEVRQESIDLILQKTTENAKRLFTRLK